MSTATRPGTDELDGLAPWQREVVAMARSPQHRALLLYLCRNGRTSCSALESACDVRSVTTRMTELVELGVPLLRVNGREPRRDGTLRPARFYEVNGLAPQPDLFETA